MTTKAKKSRKAEAIKPVILCGHCGSPVVLRQEVYRHFTLTPEPNKDGYYLDFFKVEEEDEIQQGLFCTGCDDFLTADGGYPHDHDDVPELLESGRLKLGKSK